MQNDVFWITLTLNEKTLCFERGNQHLSIDTKISPVLARNVFKCASIVHGFFFFLKRFIRILFDVFSDPVISPPGFGNPDLPTQNCDAKKASNKRKRRRRSLTPPRRTWRPSEIGRNGGRNKGGWTTFAWNSCARTSNQSGARERTP